MAILPADPAHLPLQQGQNVLVVDRAGTDREQLVGWLDDAGSKVQAASTGEEALRLVGHTPFSLSFVAADLPGVSGLAFLRRARRLTLTGAVVVVLPRGERSRLVDAVYAGADDVIRRPYSLDEVKDVIHGLDRLIRRDGLPDVDAGRRHEAEMALLTSHGMRAVQGLIEQVSQVDVTVLVTGETGVGKEVAARIIHERSPRRAAPFVKVNCAAMPIELLESEMFGHERGAFTGAHQRKPGKFEQADHGTIFLDEITDLHPALQAKLLHVLQDGEFSRIGGQENIRVDVRVIAATNRDVSAEVAAGRFREDLFYRLNVLNIVVPPLRDRVEEIPALVAYFVSRYSRLFHLPAISITAERMKVFTAHQWPGNVRELENFVKRMIVLQNPMLAVAPPGTFPGPAGVPVYGAPGVRLPLKEVSRLAVLRAERTAIRSALEECRWSRTAAAKMLKISYRALLYKMKDMGLREVPIDDLELRVS